MFTSNSESTSVMLDGCEYDSIIEAKWAMALKEAGFAFKREPIKFCKDTSKQYTPDFEAFQGVRTDRGSKENCYLEVKDSSTNFNADDLERMNISIKTDKRAWGKWFIVVGAIPNPIKCKCFTAHFVAFKYAPEQSCYFIADATMKFDGWQPYFYISSVLDPEMRGDSETVMSTNLSPIKKELQPELLVSYAKEEDGTATNNIAVRAYCIANALKEEDCNKAVYEDSLELAMSHISSSCDIPQELIDANVEKYEYTDEQVVEKLLNRQADARAYNGENCNTVMMARNMAMYLLKRICFWCNYDEEKVKRIFESSPLYKRWLWANWNEYVAPDSTTTYGELSYIKAFNSSWETIAVWAASNEWNKKEHNTR